MTDLPNRPKQSNFEVTLSTPLDSSQTTGVIFSDVPDYASGGETTQFTLLNPAGVEHITATGWNSTTNTLSGVTRGVAKYTGGPSTARAHPAGIRVVLGNPYDLYDDINTALVSKVDLAGDTITGAIDFTANSATATFRLPNMTTAVRDTIAAPANGMKIFNTTIGTEQIYDGGAWANVDTGTATVNASATVAGIGEMGTEAEVSAGTDTGGTGAQLLVGPPELAAAIQDQAYVFAADAEASDTYVITLAPATDAYVTGQRFVFTANTANTGAATLNVNGLGATSIVKGDSTALATGDILAGQVVDVVYDGTNFVMMSTPNSLVAAGDATDSHYHDATSNFRIFQNDLSFYTDVDQGAGSKTLNSGAYYTIITAGGGTDYETTYRQIADINSGLTYTFDSLTAGKKLIFEWAAHFSTATPADQDVFMGLGGNTAQARANASAVPVLKFQINNAQPQMVWNNDTGAVNTETFAISTLNAFHRFRIEFIPGTSAVFKVDGTTVGTKTTDIPTASDTETIFFFFGIIESAAATKTVNIQCDPIIMLEK